MPSRGRGGRRGRNRGPNGRYPDGTSRRRRNAAQRGPGIRNASAYSTVSGSTTRPGMSLIPMPIFGVRTRRTLRYVAGYIGVSSGAGTTGSYVFSANGLYDPDITSTGGQPKGFDQIMGFFYHYCVIRSRIRVLFASTSGGAPQVALAISGTSVPVASPESVLESGRVSTLWLMPVGVNGSHGALATSCNIGQYESKVNIIDDSRLSGDVSANPLEQTYYIIYVSYPIDSTVVSAAIQATIEYEAVFYEPRDLGLS